MTPNRKAFLDTIAYSEGTYNLGDRGYNVLFGGKLFIDYSDHPRIKTYETHDNFIHNGKLDYTTAAGRYQITATNYNYYKPLLHLQDFGPESQDLMAINFLREQKALNPIDKGNFDLAVSLARNIWASLPGAGYGQHENKLDKLREFFVASGGVLA